jgi:hypothetical protein
VQVTIFIAWYTMPTIPEHEKEFLRELYFNTKGDRWNRSHGWGKLDSLFFDPCRT